LLRQLAKDNVELNRIKAIATIEASKLSELDDTDDVKEFMTTRCINWDSDERAPEGHNMEKNAKKLGTGVSLSAGKLPDATPNVACSIQQVCSCAHVRARWVEGGSRSHKGTLSFRARERSPLPHKGTPSFGFPIAPPSNLSGDPLAVYNVGANTNRIVLLCTRPHYTTLSSAPPPPSPLPPPQPQVLDPAFRFFSFVHAQDARAAGAGGDSKAPPPNLGKLFHASEAAAAGVSVEDMTVPDLTDSRPQGMLAGMQKLFSWRHDPGQEPADGDSKGHSMGVKDFDLLKVVGKGAFGKVRLEEWGGGLRGGLRGG
jgi:hypothetical protein